MLKNNISPRQKEINLLNQQEKRFLNHKHLQNDSKLNKLLEEKVPDKLQITLEKAFVKAFELVFEKGVSAIEKTYNKDELEKNFKVQNYANKIKGDRKSFRSLRNNAEFSGKFNTLVSAATGMSMGLLGIGIPDIPLFTAFLFRSIYQTALKYGYSYDTEEEKTWILLLIQGAATFGKEQHKINEQIDYYIQNKCFSEKMTSKDIINNTAKALSKELLYMKFLQGIPLVGIVGGAYDFKYMNEITTYAEIKYRKRYYEDYTINDTNI